MKKIVEVRTARNLLTKVESTSLYIEATNLTFDELKQFHKEYREIEVTYEDSNTFVYRYMQFNAMFTVVINYHSEDVNPTAIEKTCIQI